MTKFTSKNELVGKRIELPAHTDVWMRGARYGEIKSVSEDGLKVKVRMDNPRIRRLQVVELSYSRLNP